MGYPTATGFPDHSGSYIPTLYASTLLVEFYKATVFGAIATTEHEGQLKKFGDKLQIRTLPDITVRDYVKGQDLVYETPEGGVISLDIDKGKYWSMAFNALDKKQFDIDYVTKWAVHASQNQKVAIDTDVLANVYASAHADNSGATAGAESGAFDMGETGSPKVLTASSILSWIVDCGTVLDEQNVPDENRWLTLPSWACGMLKKSDLKNANETGDSVSPLRNGLIGQIDRFEIYRTNNLAKVTDGSDSVTNAIFGHKGAIAFASQMTMTEQIKNPNDFGDLVRSLQAYGYKVQKPEALGLGYITAG